MFIPQNHPKSQQRVRTYAVLEKPVFRARWHWACSKTNFTRSPFRMNVGDLGTRLQLLFIIECKMWLLTTARSIDQFYLDQKTLHYIYAKAMGNITSQRNFHFCMVYFQPSDATRWKGQFNVQKRCPYMQRLKEARKPAFQHLEDSLFRSNNATTLYLVTEMLWYHLKHGLFLNKMWSLFWCNKLPWQRESPAKTPYIWI